MRAFGFGAPGTAHVRLPSRVQRSLDALTLSSATLSENSATGSVVGTIVGRVAGSALTLVDSAGDRFALSGANLVAGATPTNYEAATNHAVTVRETLPGAANSPRDTVLRIAIGNVFEQPALAALSLSSTSLTVGTPASGAILGASAGSAITTAGLPPGLTIDTAARRWAWSGSGSSGTSSITLTESLNDSANSPRTTTITLTIAAAPAPAFTAPPSISPASGTAGATTFTASDGTVANASGTTRRWLLSGVAIGGDPTVRPTTAGSLVLEVTASGPGGTTTTTSAAATVAAAPRFGSTVAGWGDPTLLFGKAA